MEQLAFRLFVGASLASLIASQAGGRARQTRGGSGRSSSASSGRSARKSSLSKTCQGCGLVDCGTCWPTLPSSGSMRNGVCTARPRSGRPTVAPGSLFLPAPAASRSGYNQGGAAGRVGKKRLSLDRMASQARWPTPTVSDSLGGGPTSKRPPGRQGGPLLKEITPGPLNPTWVEWLMGFPLGSTDCDFSGMPASPSKRRTRSRT